MMGMWLKKGNSNPTTLFKGVAANYYGDIYEYDMHVAEFSLYNAIPPRVHAGYF